MTPLPEQHFWLPYFIACIAIIIFILFAALVRMTHLARIRAKTLKLTNENLKNEMRERIHAEETRQQLESALLQGQKLQAMGTLAGGIAHDFNNILYAIMGFTEMAREDVEKNTLIYTNLGKIIDGAHRGQDLVARILAFSRKQHHHFDILNLKETIEAVLSLLRPTIPAGTLLHFHPVDANIMGNQTQLHQVLVNIINNAVDAMDGEGSITIQMSHVSADDPFLKQFPDAPQKKYCKMELSDTGHGMNKPTMDRIFEPFFTTKQVGKGTGLGLSIVHSIIKEHQGEIIVKSQLGQGSTFVILLPEHLR